MADEQKIDHTNKIYSVFAQNLDGQIDNENDAYLCILFCKEMMDKQAALEKQIEVFDFETNKRLTELITEIQANSTKNDEQDTALSTLEQKHDTDKAELVKSINEVVTNQDTKNTELEAKIADNLSKINKEISNRTDSDTDLSDKITAEATARSEKDTELDTKIETEIQNRKNDTTRLTKDISDESTARTTKDTALEEKITNLEAKVDAIQPGTGGDGTTVDLTEVNKKISDLDGKITTETTTRSEKDTSHDEQIAALEAKDVELEAKIDNKVEQSAIDTAVADLASKTFVSEEIAKAQLDGKDIDLTGYSTKEYVDTKISDVELNIANKLSSEDAEKTYATKDEVNSKIGQNELDTAKKELQDAIDAIPQYDDTEIKAKISKKVEQSAIDTAVADKLTKDEASTTYATKDEIPDISNLATKEELKNAIDNIPAGETVDLTDINNKITALETLGTELDGKITTESTSRSEKDTEIEGKITSLETKDTSHDEKITELEMKDTELDNKIDNSLTTMKNLITANTSTLRKDLVAATTYNTKVTELSNKDTELENKINTKINSDFFQGGAAGFNGLLVLSEDEYNQLGQEVIAQPVLIFVY